MCHAIITVAFLSGSSHQGHNLPSDARPLNHGLCRLCCEGRGFTFVAGVCLVFPRCVLCWLQTGSQQEREPLGDRQHRHGHGFRVHRQLFVPPELLHQSPIRRSLRLVSRLETASWQCSSRSDVLEYSTFCKDVNTHARTSNRRRELYERLQGRSYSDQHTLCSLEGFVVSVVDTYTNGTLFIAERTMHIRPRTTAHPCS